jgi:hypothetical protein
VKQSETLFTFFNLTTSLEFELLLPAFYLYESDHELHKR